MKIKCKLVAFLVAVFTFAGCATWDKFDNQEKGAIIGGGSGALIGDAVAPGVGGTVIGGALGAVGGGVIGNQQDDHRQDRIR